MTILVQCHTLGDIFLNCFITCENLNPYFCHIFKKYIFYRLSIPKNNNLRIQLGAANTLTEFKRIVNVIKDLYEPFHEGDKVWQDTTEPDSENLILPPWLCQPYVRACPEEHLKKVEENSNVFLELFFVFVCLLLFFRNTKLNDILKIVKEIK